MRHTQRLGFRHRIVGEIYCEPEPLKAILRQRQVKLPQNFRKEAFMTLRRTLTGLALCMMALALFLGCVESGPPPPPPIVESPPPPPPSHYFVTVNGLALREGPTTGSSQIGTLYFNDEVEIMDTSGGWARVLDVQRNRTGWASMRYLQPMPAGRPQTPRRQAPAPKETPKPSEPPKAM